MNQCQHRIELARAPQFFTGCVPGWGRPCVLLYFSLHLVPGRQLDLVQLDRSVQAVFPGVAIKEAGQAQTAAAQLVERIRTWCVALMVYARLPAPRDEDLVKAMKIKPGWEGLVLACPLQNHSSIVSVVVWLTQVINSALAGESLTIAAKHLPALLQTLRASAPQGMNTLRFLEAADHAGIPWQKVWDNVIQFGWGANARWLDSSFTDVTPNISTKLARNKLATSALLRRAGIPVPDHGLVSDAEAAVKLAEQLGYPVVVKPANLDGGKGVAPGLKTAQSVIKAFAAAARLSSVILVEKHFEGRDYRLQVFQNEVFWVADRVPGGVTGDGIHSIAELLAVVNAHPLRGEPGTSALLKRIALDDEALELLAEQGFSAQAIPPIDKFVRLRRAANVASGGMPVPALEHAHPDNLALAVRAARLLRLDLAGVDLLIPDIHRSWLESGAAICEVNAQPQLSPHLPAYLLSRLVNKQGRIPVVVILGLATMSGLGDQIVENLSGSGIRVGMATPDAVTIESRVVMKTPKHVCDGGLALIADPSVDLIVLFLSDESILQTGLPVHRFDVLVLAGPPQAAPAAATWQRWCSFASFILRACSGPVILNTECAQWSGMQPQLIKRDVRGMPLADIPASLTRELLKH